MNQKPLLCPFCGKELILGEQRKYETLADHVCDPNREDYPLRNTYVCTCGDALNSFWDEWGAFYSSTFKYGEQITSAINSGARECDERHAKEDKLRKTAFGRTYLKIKREVSYLRYCFICKIKGYKTT